VGGVVGGDDSDEAWVFRPSLVGPFTNDDLVVRFEDAAASQLFSVTDPGQVEPLVGQSPGVRLISSGDVGAIASQMGLISGPQLVAGTVTATVSAEDGLAILMSYRDPGEYMLLSLRPGQEATLLRVQNGVVSPVQGCQAGPVVQILESEGGIAVEVEFGDGSVSARINDEAALDCASLDPIERGHVGVGVLGPEGSALSVFAVAVTR
jgi:hypothetical protein